MRFTRQGGQGRVPERRAYSSVTSPDVRGFTGRVVADGMMSAMGTAQAITLLLAAAACLLGLTVVIVLWRMRRRRTRSVVSGHPAHRPPIAVGLHTLDGERRLRIDVRPGAPTVAIDIVSYRPATQDAPWRSEPFVEPLLIEPSGWVTLPSALEEANELDVIVAWTARHATGEVLGSRTFRVTGSRRNPEVVSLPRRPGLAALPALALFVLLSGAAAVVGIALVSDTAGSATPPTASIPETGDVSPAGPVGPTTSTTTSTSTSTSTSTTVSTSASTTTAATASATTAGASATATGTASVTTTTGPTSTDAPGGVGASSPTVEPPHEPSVIISGYVGPCRFGDACLIVGFEITGFGSRPQEYVCEFGDGSRFTFSFDSGGVAEACSSGSPDASVVIEVDGVRSEPLTRADL